MQVPFIQGNLLRLCTDRETPFGSLTMELSVTGSVFPRYDLRPFYTTELLQKKHFISITIMSFGVVS